LGAVEFHKVVSSQLILGEVADFIPVIVKCGSEKNVKFGPYLPKLSLMQLWHFLWLTVYCGSLLSISTVQWVPGNLSIADNTSDVNKTTKYNAWHRNVSNFCATFDDLMSSN